MILQNFKKFSIEIIALASLITSFSVLITIPNGVIDYYKTRTWEKNVKIIRLSSIDYIVVYNGNPKPIFVNRFEYKSYVLEQAGTSEINQTIPPYSYMNFNNDKGQVPKWNTIFNGNDIELENVKKIGLNNLNSPFNLVFYNQGHHLLKLMPNIEVIPRTFDFDVNLYINFENEEKIFPVKVTGLIVYKK